VGVADHALDDGERRRHLDTGFVEASEEMRESRQGQLARHVAYDGQVQDPPVPPLGPARRLHAQPVEQVQDGEGREDHEAVRGDEGACRLHDARR